MKIKKLRHPIQPLVIDEHGVLRFKENKIIRFLMEKSGFDLNKLAIEKFSVEDREQLAQLIGYSHGGFSELSYASRRVKDKSWMRYEKRKKQEAENEN